MNNPLTNMDRTLPVFESGVRLERLSEKGGWCVCTLFSSKHYKCFTASGATPRAAVEATIKMIDEFYKECECRNWDSRMNGEGYVCRECGKEWEHAENL